MLFLKMLFSIFIISLVESVPIDDKKNLDGKRISYRRETLDSYKYNHPPSIAIPVSIVFEENGSGDEKSGKFLKLKTEIPDEKQAPVPLHEPSSVAIPVSVVFEEETSANDKLTKFSKLNPVTLVQTPVPSKESSPIAIPVSVLSEEESFISGGLTESNKLNQKLPVHKPIRSRKPSSEAIPVSIVLEEEGSKNIKAFETEKQNLETKTRKQATSNEKSAIGIPVAVVFEEEGVQNSKVLKSEKQIPDHTPNKQNNSKETKKEVHGTEPTVFTSNESVMSNNDIEVQKAHKSQTAEPNLKEEKSKVILKSQPRQYQLEYQIPVAVVYDEPIDIQTSRRLKNSKQQVRGRNTRRRRPNSTATTEPTIKTTIVVDDTQSKLTKSVVKQNIRSRQQNIPVVIQFTNENQNTEPRHRQEKTTTNSIPTTEANSGKLTSNRRNQPKTPLQTQNRKSSFEAQQKEERKQDYESAKKRERDPIVPIVKSDSHAYGNSGSFSYSYEGGDGTKAFQKSELKTFKDNKTGEAVVGGFSYKDKDGNDISLSYTADENGYHPVGDHLPTPPPIPVAIQRALEYLATKTTPAPVTEAGEDLKET